MSKLKLNITMSIDGFVAGPGQSPEHPLGIGGEDLLGKRRARVDLAAFFAVALAERLKRIKPSVELLTSDPERMLR